MRAALAYDLSTKAGMRHMVVEPLPSVFVTEGSEDPWVEGNGYDSTGAPEPIEASRKQIVVCKEFDRPVGKRSWLAKKVTENIDDDGKVSFTNKQLKPSEKFGMVDGDGVFRVYDRRDDGTEPEDGTNPVGKIDNFATKYNVLPGDKSIASRQTKAQWPLVVLFRRKAGSDPAPKVKGEKCVHAMLELGEKSLQTQDWDRAFERMQADSLRSSLIEEMSNAFACV